MKITPQQSRKCLYPTIAAITAMVSGISCTQEEIQKKLPGIVASSDERMEPVEQRMSGIHYMPETNEKKDIYNRPKQHVIGKARVDTPPSNEDESTYIKWDEQMTVGYISPL